MIVSPAVAQRGGGGFGGGRVGGVGPGAVANRPVMGPRNPVVPFLGNVVPPLGSPFLFGRGRGFYPPWGWWGGWGWATLPFGDYGDWDWGNTQEQTSYQSQTGYPTQPMGYPMGYSGGFGPTMMAPAPERVIQPILLERRGNQWVEVKGYSQEPTAAAPPTAAEAGEPSPPRRYRPEASEARRPGQPLRHRQRPSPVPPSNVEAAPAPPPAPLPPAILVLRDGRQFEVKSYAIIGNTLYAHQDYWTTGRWTRRIQISSLDIPATLKVNQERGSNFRLPSGPREVIVRP